MIWSAYILCEASFYESLLCGTQPLRVFRKIWNVEAQYHRCNTSQKTLWARMIKQVINDKLKWTHRGWKSTSMLHIRQSLPYATSRWLVIRVRFAKRCRITAAASKPPKAPARLENAKRNEIRFCASSRLYHLNENKGVFEISRARSKSSTNIDMRYKNPGNIPPSQSPTKNLVARRPERFLTVPWRQVHMPNMNMHPGTVGVRFSTCGV